MGSTLYLIDGHYQIYRSFFGMRALTASDGTQVQASFGIADLLQRVQRKYRPAYWAIAMDTSVPTFRHELYTAYKATRLEMPPELAAQLPAIEKILQGFRIPVLRAPGFEADDILATLARRFEREGLEVRLLTRDKDLEQVLSDRIKFLDAATGETFGPEELLAKKGITPARVAEYQALIGDSSDNIPGVAGIGPKTATKVLACVNDVEELLAADAAPGQLPAPTLEKIRSHADELRLSRRLATLCTDLAIAPRIADLQAVPADAAALGEVYRKLGFRRLLDELSEDRDIEHSAATRIDSNAKPAGAGAPIPEPAFEKVQGQYRLIDTAEALAGMIAACRARGRFAFDTETTGLDPIAARAVGFSVAVSSGSAWYVPLESPSGAAFLPRAEILRHLRPLLEDESVGKIGHNIKYDMQVMRNDGVTVRGVNFDSMIAAYLINSTRNSYKLDTLVGELFGHAMIPITDLLGAGAAERTMDQLLPNEICDYAAEDADYTLRLAERLEPEIRDAGLDRVSALETALIPVLVAMEREGVTVDLLRLTELESEVISQAAGVESEVFREAGANFNINSPKQLQEILFDKLGFPATQRTKSGFSTAAEVLEELAVSYPKRRLPSLILEHRQLHKLLGTYIQALPRLVNRKTGRLHTDFRQTVAATGRLASTEPNLQNIPIKSELGRRIRQAFVPNDAGQLFLSADYSQIEIRLLAHLSGDTSLQRYLREGQDIHRQVAATLNRKAPADVTREERQAAKAVNFGVIYGMGAFGLARELGITIAEARTFIEAFFASYPGVRQFTERTIAETRESGYARTMLGRRRPIPEIRSRIPHQRSQGERFAVNTVVQGSAADLIKQAMVAIHHRLCAGESRVRMLLQIHDELLFSVPRDMIGDVADEVRKIMEQVDQLDVPLEVHVAKGENWYDASK